METLFGHEARFKPGLRKVADGVHAWLQPNGSWGESNAALVVGDGESLLVDTLWTPALTRRMLDRMARLTKDAPITRLVNTHADGDHCWGNELLADVEIVATDHAAEEMRAVAPGTLEGVRRFARVLSLAGRSPLPYLGRGAARGAGEYFLEMFRPYDWSGITLTPPTRTFSGTLSLDAGGREVELIEVAPAHTPGDLIVHVPDVRTVIAADILFIGVTPIIWTRYVDNWIRAIDRILELEPDVILPGHGPPTDADGARAVQDYWRYVDAAARREFARGRSPFDAAQAILARDDFPFADLDNPERLVVNLHRLKPDAPEQVSTLGRLRIFSEVGRI